MVIPAGFSSLTPYVVREVIRLTRSFKASLDSASFACSNLRKVSFGKYFFSFVVCSNLIRRNFQFAYAVSKGIKYSKMFLCTIFPYIKTYFKKSTNFIVRHHNEKKNCNRLRPHI